MTVACSYFGEHGVFAGVFIFGVFVFGMVLGRDLWRPR